MPQLGNLSDLGLEKKPQVHSWAFQRDWSKGSGKPASDLGGGVGGCGATWPASLNVHACANA